MRKFVATAAIAASAAATLAMTPLAAHAATPSDSEIRTGCQNGITGWYTPPTGHSVAFELVPGTAFVIPAADNEPGVWSFSINQPNSLESYGPALGADKSGGWEHQRVEKAIVNQIGGAEHIFFNDKANGFSFNNPVGRETFSVYYQCGIGKA